MRFIRYFIPLAGVVLLMAAVTRFLSAFGDAQVLSVPEPLLGIPLRYAVLLVGGIELAVAWICLFGKHIGHQIGWLTWMSADYVVYWLGLAWQHCSSQGSCIGSLIDPLWLYHGTMGYVFQAMPFALVLGSCVAAVSFRFSSQARMSRMAEGREFAARADAAAGLMKMFCPACGGHVKFAMENIGEQLACPHCQVGIVLRKPDESLKMTCVLCGGHIEFPPHAIGQKIRCPHCAKNITLLSRT